MGENPPWEANSCSISQEIAGTLWKPTVHYHAHKSPPLVATLYQINAVHTLLPYVLRHSTQQAPYLGVSLNLFLSARLSYQSLVCIPL
jgi:hypothetical protein